MPQQCFVYEPYKRLKTFVVSHFLNKFGYFEVYKLYNPVIRLQAVHIWIYGKMISIP